MKKCIVLFLLALVFYQNSFSQISAIKKQMKEIFFEINFPTTKYDLRKMLSSDDNFSKIENNSIGKYDAIISNFHENLKLSYTNDADVKQFVYWFYLDSDKNYCATLELYYSIDAISECTKQLNELNGFLKSISFKSVKKDELLNGVKIGDFYYFYSSTKSYQSNNPFLLIDIAEVDFGKGKQYSLIIKYYFNDLY